MTKTKNFFMETNMTTFQTKVVYSFNNFYLNFLTDLKKYNDEFKKVVRKEFKVFDRASNVYFDAMKVSFDQSSDDLMVTLIPGFTFNDIADKVENQDVDVLKSYLYIFKALVSIYLDEDESILEKVLEIIKAIQNQEVSDEEIQEKIKDVLDDDLSTSLHNLMSVLRQKDTEASSEALPDMFSMLENSKIGELAKEISNEINIKDLNLENPEQLLNFSNLSGSNNALGNIISKVSTKIQKKIEDGDISQSELVNEALSLVGMMNQGGGGANNILNNPMFSELFSGIAGMSGMKAPGGGKGAKVQVDQNKVKNLDTRQRLRDKLEKKRKDKEQQDKKNGASTSTN